MPNRVIQRMPVPSAPSAIPFAEDGVNRLEPMAVPMARMMSILRRGFWVVVLAVLVGIGGTTLFVTSMARLYTAEASIVIEPQRTQVSDLQAISPDVSDANGLMRTQIDILGSPALAANVVKVLHLTSLPEFTPRESRLHADIKLLLRRIGFTASLPAAPVTGADAVESAAAILRSKISFANEARSSVLNVAVTTRNADLSASIANELAQQYLSFKRQEKFDAIQRAHDWFQAQMVTLGAKVRANDLAVSQYRQLHKLDEESTDSSGMHSGTVNRQQLDALSRDLVDVSRERTLKEGELEQAQLALRGHASANALPAVVVSPVVGQLLAEESVAVAHEAELATTEGDRNPELGAVRAQIKRLQHSTQLEVASVAGSLQIEVEAARAQEAALQQRMEQLRGAVSGENSAEVGLQALQTDAQATRNIYESFLTRATQLANVAGIQEPDASLVSSATPPLSPSAPQSARLVEVAALLSLVAGIALACGLERLRTGFSMPEQLESQLGLPLIGLVPNVSNRLRRSSRGRGASAFSASMDRLRGQMRTMGEERPRTLMVTSALPKEGKSVFAAGLARNMAAAGWRVLLIECDLCCPSLSREFDVKPGPGLSDILSGKLLGRLQDVIHEPAPGLQVIMAGRRQGDTQELLASDRMSQLILSVRETYDLVILDTPPVLPVSDALILARHVDATMMVVRWEKTGRNAAQDAVRLLQDSRAQILGAVMTRIDLRTASHLAGRMSYAFTHYDGYHTAQS